MDNDDLAALVLILISLSLMSIGGGTSVIAGMEHAIVSQNNWMSPSEFLQAFALSRAAPGPGTMLATLIGWQLSGWTGALAATLAFFLPSSMLFYLVFRTSNRHRDQHWHRVVREGLAPVGVGLMTAGVISVMRVAGTGFLSVCITLAAAALLYRFPRVPALTVIIAGGLVAMAPDLLL